MPNEVLRQEIIECSSVLEGLIQRDSRNPIIQSFYMLEAASRQGELDSRHVDKVKNTLQRVKRVIDKLKLATEAVEYVKKHLKPTNRPVDMEAHRNLEKVRNKINDADLIKTFGMLKKKREEIDKAVPNRDIKSFEQAAYRKGTGTSIRQWAHHILTEHDKAKRYATKERVSGNCTEQSNLAFSYLYSRFNEQYCKDDKHVKLFSKLERIDIDNTIGGHVQLLLDRDPAGDVFTDKKCHATDLLSQSDELGEECIVIDPWNEDTPIYMASDMATCMPECGRKGRVNIEFGLDFSNQDPSSAPSLQ